MLALRDSYLVTVKDKRHALEALRDPKTMGVIYLDAWSEKTREAARQIVAEPDYTREGASHYLYALPRSHPLNCNAAFKEDLRVLRSFFKGLGTGLLDRDFLGDSSRIEAAVMPKRHRNMEWHVDPVALAGLGMPAGPTVEILPERIKGTRNGIVFTPADPLKANNTAISLPANAFVVMKSQTYPDPKNNPDQGLLHRRPPIELSPLPQPGRVVIHFHVV